MDYPLTLEEVYKHHQRKDNTVKFPNNLFLNFVVYVVEVCIMYSFKLTQVTVNLLIICLLQAEV